MHKIITLSFDDCVTQDKRFIELLKKYNLTCTFNVNSALLGQTGNLRAGEKSCTHNKNTAEELASLYDGFEVAAHTRTHPMLTSLHPQDIVEEVVGDYLKLSELVGYPVRGMAYPGGHPNCDRLVTDVIRKYTRICYARTIVSAYNFDFPQDFLLWNPTVAFCEERTEEMVSRFEELNTDGLLYIWGHSYEFDLFDCWERAERILKSLSRIKNATCMTNMQIYRLYH